MKGEGRTLFMHRSTGGASVVQSKAEMDVNIFALQEYLHLGHTVNFFQICDW